MQLRELIVIYRNRPGLDEVEERLCLVPPDAYAILKPILAEESVEVFAVLFLNIRRKLLAYHEVSRGSLDAVHVQARDIFKAALLAHASGVILAHNHPSGDPSPSTDDLVWTQRLVEVGRLLDIEVVDHVIVGNDAFYSFKAAGRL